MMQPITTFSETPTEYASDIAACGSLEELLATLQSYAEVAPDAIAAAPKTQEDFAAFQKGLKKERSGKFAGKKFSDRYGAVMQPEILMRVTLFAFDYKVPFGVAYSRLKELGKLPKITVDNRIQR